MNIMAQVHSNQIPEQQDVSMKDLLSSNLHENDVICGRGKHCFNHPGNRKFRYFIDTFLPSYAAASCKLEKSNVVSDIVDAVRRNSPYGGFVKQDEFGVWSEVGDRLAREKVGQALRDALHTLYRSSTESKKKRRKVEQAQQYDSVSGLIESNTEISAVFTNLLREVSDELSDHHVGALFDAANAAILQELKRLDCRQYCF
jgi:hypothetical protein